MYGSSLCHGGAENDEADGDTYGGKDPVPENINAADGFFKDLVRQVPVRRIPEKKYTKCPSQNTADAVEDGLGVVGIFPVNQYTH